MSDQIQTRLPILSERSLKITKSENAFLKQDFLDELTLFSERYLTSKRFLAGIGLAYAYIPTVTYKGNAKIDLSSFQPTIGGGSHTLDFTNEFSDKSFQSLSLSAKIPFFTVQALFPLYEEEQTTIIPVEFVDLKDTDRDILFSSTITSKLKMDFDVNIKLSLLELIEKWRGYESSAQMDYGFGVGIIGFQVKDSVVTDIRFRTDTSKSFSDLTTSHTLNSSNDRSHNSLYGIIYYNIELADEFVVGIDFKYYGSNDGKNDSIDVDGFSTSLNVTWYPTLNWL